MNIARRIDPMYDRPRIEQRTIADKIALKIADLNSLRGPLNEARSRYPGMTAEMVAANEARDANLRARVEVLWLLADDFDLGDAVAERVLTRSGDELSDGMEAV